VRGVWVDACALTLNETLLQLLQGATCLRTIRGSAQPAAEVLAAVWPTFPIFLREPEVWSGVVVRLIEWYLAPTRTGRSKAWD